jgi:deoxyhypusine synthase
LLPNHPDSIARGVVGVTIVGRFSKADITIVVTTSAAVASTGVRVVIAPIIVVKMLVEDVLLSFLL